MRHKLALHQPKINAMLSHLLLVLCIVWFSHNINSSPGFRNGGDDRKNLIVGEELWKETIPLRLGSRVYELQGLKSHTWYEVKISYPASIPASFTIQLKKDDSDPGMNRVVRRLLNTEKLIFKSDVILDSNQSKLCVLVRVEPEGVVAIPNVFFQTTSIQAEDQWSVSGFKSPRSKVSSLKMKMVEDELDESDLQSDGLGRISKFKAFRSLPTRPKRMFSKLMSINRNSSEKN